MRQTIKVADKPTADEIKSTVESNAEKLDGIIQELESGGMLSDPKLGLAALKQSLDELKNYVGNGKRDVASAITGKGVPTATDAGFATLINNIDKIVTLMQGTQDANAAAQQILNGYSAYVKGAKVDGSMANRGAVSHSLAANGSYTIPAGYHNGGGKVTQSLATQGAQTITPGAADKTIAANRYLTGVQTIKGDANLIPGNIIKGKTIFGVTGNHEGSCVVKEVGYNLVQSSSYSSSYKFAIEDDVHINLPFAPELALLDIRVLKSGNIYHFGKLACWVKDVDWYPNFAHGVQRSTVLGNNMYSNDVTVSDIPINIYFDHAGKLIVLSYGAASWGGSYYDGEGKVMKFRDEDGYKPPEILSIKLYVT